MADTEKLTLAVDIEIAKHDLLLDRLVSEVEKRVVANQQREAAGDKLDRADYELGIAKRIATDAQVSLDLVRRDYDMQSNIAVRVIDERNALVAALRELLTTTELYLGHVHQNPKTGLALRSQLSSAVGVACVKAGDLLRKQVPF